MGLSSNCSPDRQQIYQLVVPGGTHKNTPFPACMPALCYILNLISADRAGKNDITFFSLYYL